MTKDRPNKTCIDWSGLAAGCGNVKDSGFLGRIFITTNQLLNCLYHLNREDAQRVNHLIKKLEFLDDSQHQLGYCGLWCLLYVGSCPIVCRGERGRETDCDDDDDDASADGDREEDEDEYEDHIDEMILMIVVFCREKRGGDGDQESDKECPRNRRDAGCIWWSWRSPSFTAIFSISMFTGCPKRIVEQKKNPNLY